ncbi:MAG: AAA family ATPase [Dysgonamonadaceae bacterium]|jgi:transitional endoplasmic reticulum ATPase|nr:AAA family ATPase [Dysgonamonadaceae bacterium]
MNKMQSAILSKNFILEDKYTILLFIKKGCNAETYRVKGKDGKLYFLKLFNPAQTHHTAFDATGNLLEIELLKNLKHPNIVSYKDSGETVVENKKYFYLVLNFIAGETLMERIIREQVSSVYDIRQILSGVLNGLKYLHSLPEPIIHNEITPQNIMLDLSGETPQAKIIDFGYARLFHQSSKTYNKERLNLHYVASECITAGTFSPQSDLFSAGAVMYQLLFGTPPWNRAISSYEAMRANEKELILEAREKSLAFPNISNRIVDFDDSVLAILTKALHADSERRFQSAMEFLQALNGEIAVEKPVKSLEKTDSKISTSKIKPKRGKGFAAIAGMQQLKDQMKTDVIDVIKNPEEYKRHNLGLPNGMLLYGPPGCGKTFFAERFAEEAGYNFIKIIASDIASIYVHGTQEKIGKIFKEAWEKAPTILYFDELDTMTPNREKATHSYGSEVNEFLSQLDNVGDSGVFVIGSTNQPQLIDKAILRAGRLEKWFYIPPPDFEARKALFELYLKSRPLDFGIDYNKLAMLTENYVSSDIKLLIDEASRKTIKDKIKRISMETLEFVIKNQKPTISLADLKKHEAIKKEMEEGKAEPERRRIGFK